ncbi:c-type cytochrome [Halodesulfovibrio spirochaetisodalis]|uniref:Cytochrome c domain-containing protein n=1 Tax=Halodesulfovibrio spirochaetisodalis TaxID=1560234 RepID=A0A1B7XBM1_9BACT|nr:c-type cytochrome [Halodesulfovibrio spirochaetisodalis]OBQ50122.1 hypothetical protein SP90_10825 [Halodesulfovibrio spirochaetisodalis]
MEKNTPAFRRFTYILVLLLTLLLLYIIWVTPRPDVQIKETRFIIAGIPIKERCISCHNLQKHSAVSGHSITGESCTACHDGIGIGVTKEIAHSRTAQVSVPKTVAGKNWRAVLRTGDTVPDLPKGFTGEHAQQLLAGGDTSAACIRCHSPLSLNPDLPVVKGFTAFSEAGCAQCHAISGTSSGATGPALDTIGDVLSLPTLKKRIKIPQAVLYSRMPVLLLTEEKIHNIALFLKGQSKKYLRKTAYIIPQKSMDTIEGANCLSCHTVNETGNTVAPDLSFISLQRSSEWVTKFIARPSQMRTGARMPSFLLSNASLLQNNLFSKTGTLSLPSSPARQYAQLCAPCHGEKGNGLGEVAHNLTSSPRRFEGNAEYFRLQKTKKLRVSLEQGIQGTSMPPFNSVITETKLDALLQYVLDTKVTPLPFVEITDMHVPVKQKASRIWGEVLYILNCKKCHGSDGAKSSRLITRKEYPLPRNLADTEYMKQLSDADLFKAISRGIPGTRMKAYGIHLAGTSIRVKRSFSPVSIWSLVDKVRNFSNVQH